MYIFICLTDIYMYLFNSSFHVYIYLFNSYFYVYIYLFNSYLYFYIYLFNSYLLICLFIYLFNSYFNVYIQLAFKLVMLDNFVSSVAAETFCTLWFFKLFLHVSTWKISNNKRISVVLGYVFS